MAPEPSPSHAAPDGVSRRRFLTVAGAGVLGATALGSADILLGGATHAAASTVNQFGRMFPSLPPFAPASDAVKAALADIGKVGGLMDAKDPLNQGAEALAENQAFSNNNLDNTTHTAGTTYFGQFVDHDLTLDNTTQPGVPSPLPANGRTTALDLDSLYGGGPSASPALYNPADMAKFKVGFGGRFEDLPRQPNNVAIVGDARNDENLILGGLTAGYLLFHNKVVDRLRSQGVPNSQVFAQARQLVTWHYQWVIVHEFLPQIIGWAMWQNIQQSGRQVYRPEPGPAFMPVEFAGAAYRFGHSQVRPSYLVNSTGDNGQEFYAFIFDASQSGSDPGDLRGGVRAPRRYVDWPFFFEFFSGTPIRWNKRIDTRISTPILNLPVGTLPGGTGPASIATRDLLRHLTYGLPSGQAVARAIGAQVLGPDRFRELAPYGLGFDANTPLWYYILREADQMTGALSLGTVGGRIVGETIFGILQLDPTSYLNQPNWKHTLPARVQGQFTQADLLNFAGVGPANRH